MQTHVDQTEENKSKSTANGLSLTQSEVVSSLYGPDNQSRYQDIANNSPQVKQLKAFHEIANNSFQAKQSAIFQRMATNRSTVREQAVQLQSAGSGVIQRVGEMENEVNLAKTAKRYKKSRPWNHPFRKLPQEKIVEDAIKARDFLRNMEGVVKPALRQLEQDIHAQLKMSSAEQPNARHLTRSLAVREKQCGLEATTSNYTRLLSADDFTQEAAKGALFNDWGALTAAITHGEYTHRIQWYVLMYAMSGRFENDIANEPPEGFHHTPKEFLKGINLGGVTLEQAELGTSGIRPTEQEGGHTLWDVLFDRPSLGRGGTDPENQEIGITDPERFMTMLDQREMKGAMGRIAGHLSEDAPDLSEILTRRLLLRLSQRDPSAGLGGLDPEEYEERKIASGSYTREGRGLLVRNEPQSLVGSKARGEEVVPYAPSVRI